MSKGDVKRLKAKIDKLVSYAFSTTPIEEYEKSIKPSLTDYEGSTCYAVFITVCDTKTRAKVFHASGTTLNEALEKSKDNAISALNNTDLDPKWVKLELVADSKELSLKEATEIMFSSYNEFFRKGISMDRQYENAYTEGEINGNRLLNYKEKKFEIETFNKYNAKKGLNTIPESPETLILFECDGFFINGRDELYTLYRSGYDCGRRQIDMITPEVVKSVITGGMNYLINQMHPAGYFDYGYYPIFHKLIPNYNIVRHTSTLWSLVWSSQVITDNRIQKTAQNAIRYMLHEISYQGDDCAFLVEKDSNEIKLGGNGVAIIALTQYMKIFGTTEYVELCEKLGNGILRMMKDDGSFVHVLYADTLEVKEEHRIVYYDGEAGFALSRLAAISSDKDKWVKAAEKVCDHFIKGKYEKYRDHWVAYALNELTMYSPKKEYYEFAMRNIWVNIDKIYQQGTSYHTYLEMLMAGYETYRRMQHDKIEINYPEGFSITKFADAIFHRAEHMLNGYGYPELVMYLKKPSYFLGAFFVRHDGFRVRIDDVQHFSGAYIAFYTRYDELLELKSPKMV